MKPTFYRSFEIHFDAPIVLGFRIFDFPAAQKWAALLDACVSMSKSSRRIQTLFYQHPRELMLRKLEFALLDLFPDNEFQQWFRNWRNSENPLATGFKFELNAHLRRMEDRARDRRDENELWRIENLKILSRQTFGTTRLGSRTAFRCTIDVMGWRGAQPIHLPMETIDTRRYRCERMPGGVRLMGFPLSRSAIECADAGDIQTLPMQIRQITPSFRVDLATQYPSFEGTDSRKRFDLWRKKTLYDESSPGKWGNYYYVAQLSENFEDEAEALGQLNLSGRELSIEKILVHRVPK